MSLEEKRERLLGFFTREHAFYSIKEVEASGAKHTGVHAMQIKELLQSLVDDGLVSAEKCGASVVYWRFAHDRAKMERAVLSSREQRLSEREAKVAQLRSELACEQARRLRGDGCERAALVESLQLRKHQLAGQLGDVFDVERVRGVREVLEHQVQQAEALSDNVEAVVCHFARRDVPREVFINEVGVPAEFCALPVVSALFDALQ